MGKAAFVIISAATTPSHASVPEPLIIVSDLLISSMELSLNH